MKTSQTLLKNLRLLFRSRETAFLILFGPLLIILLVGFAFSGSSEVEITLGVYSNDFSPLADEIIQSLNSDYRVNIFASQDECLEQLQIGLTHLCIIFPEDFEVKENKVNDIEFHMDPSRINLVYSIIDELSSEFSIKRDSLSKELTDTLLIRLGTTKGIVGEQSNQIKAAQVLRSDAATSLSRTEGLGNSSDINFSVIDLRAVRGRATSIEEDARLLYEEGEQSLKSGMELLQNIKSSCDECSNSTVMLLEDTIKDFEAARIELDVVFEESPQKLQDIYRLIDTASNQVESIEGSYNSAQEDTEYIISQVLLARNSLGEMNKLLATAQGSLEYSYELLDDIPVAESNSIVNPISTVIKPVTTETSNLSFTYPYVLMLVIMFMGLIIGSSLIVNDRNSRAAFRNFTAATRDEFHIIMSFFTTLIILCAQVAVILLASYFLVSAPLLNNFKTSVTVILLAVTLFSFLGMMLGYLSRTQEAAMIGAITLGSVMLFISNLVIPIEGMNAIIRSFTSINPYVLLSELLKKSMLFGVTTEQFRSQLLLMFVIVVVLFLTILGIQRYVRYRYFQSRRTIEVTHSSQKAKPLLLNNTKVFDEYELLSVLDVMTRKNFSEIVSDEKNIIAQWVADEVKNRSLARKLRTDSKEKMILALDKHLKKMTKKRMKK